VKKFVSKFILYDKYMIMPFLLFISALLKIFSSNLLYLIAIILIYL